MEKITNYRDAVTYCGNSLILCNNICEVDESFGADDCLGPWIDPDDADYYPEIYQYYLTNCSYDDARYLADRFGLLFQYSNALDLWVLCVPHFGTMWVGVPVTDNGPIY